MRIGANIDLSAKNPEEWVAMLQSMRGRTAVVPINSKADATTRRDYLRAAKANDITFAEVGVWNNPLHLDEAERKAAMDYCAEQLALAEEMGAACCVNVAGARGMMWNAAYPENRSSDTYALIVETVRQIIDAVKPKKTFYTLEPVGWMYPATAEEYLQLIHDIDRNAFAVHLDYTNMVIGVMEYAKREQVIDDCFRLLGPYIKCVHAKDIRLENDTPCHIREVLPGLGEINFGQVLRLMEGLPPDMPILVEHLQTLEECRAATAHLYSIAAQEGIQV